MSCSLFQSSIKLNDVLILKEKMDKSQNPAKIELLRRQLRQEIVELKNILVKDISVSNKIDYDFVVVSDVKTEKGMVECYIYSKNIKTISLIHIRHIPSIFTLIIIRICFKIHPSITCTAPSIIY